jgi:hypothetical protein
VRNFIVDTFLVINGKEKVRYDIEMICDAHSQVESGLWRRVPVDIWMGDHGV